MKDLEKVLQQYRILHTPTQYSVYQFYANQTFSHDDLLLCSEDEKKSFYERVEEGKITICNKITDKEGQIGTLHALINNIMDPTRENLKKIERNVIYSSVDGKRPIGAHAFDQWGGFQVIDMDIKDRKHATYVKDHLFKRLIKYNWFLGIAYSSSGKGLHVYTKIRTSDDVSSDKRKILYLTNFRHKYSFVYLAMLKVIENMTNDDGSSVTKDQMMEWLDFAMFKPQQGAFIGYDAHPLINTHFFEDFIYVNFDNVEDMGHPDVDWVSYPDLKEAFKRWEWFEEDDQPADIEVKDAPELEVDTHNPIHYKHNERWKLANTLVKLYGKEQGFKYLRMICTKATSTKELQSDCITAARHDKPVDIWAINILNKRHGFQIKVNIDQEEKDLSVLYENIENIDNPTLIRESPHTERFHLKKNEYLSDIKTQLLKKCGLITLIEAGAGVGKTEMVKQIVNEGKRVLLVMPFTSTIKSKIEDDDNWDYSYGNKKPKFDSKRGIALTIDKFARLNMMELKEMGFDYIFVDESHLLFQSEYRPVMAKVIEMISTTEVPIILMSGTPVGETVFFDDIIHLKVTKDDVRKKVFKAYLTDRPIDNLCHMCRKMAEDVANGRRCLFPTNQGSIFKEQIEVMITYFMKVDHQIFDRKPIVRYYKKANLGEEFMDKVNFEKTVDDTDVLLCSTYLSVGVDILDKFDFNIYFNEIWMPQEIEQFANRLRSHDLFINIFLNRKNAAGDSINIIGYKACNFELDADEIKDVHAIIRSCNAMIERNPIEYRYNPLVSSITRDNKFIEYNEIENKFYLNEVAYKTIMFERKYRDYVQQLPVLAKGMMSYGYEYDSVELGEFKNISEDFIVKDDIKALIDQAKQSEQARSTHMVDELIEQITEDRLHIYRDVIGGKYEIKKGKEWSEDQEKHVMIVKNAEVFDRVVPLFLSMSKMFDVEDIYDIFQHCRNKNSTYNFAAIRRVRVLTNIIYNTKLDRLDIPIKNYIESVYKFVDDNPAVHKLELVRFIQEKTREYAANDSNAKIIIANSPVTMETFYKKLYDIFKCLVDVGRPNKQKMVTLEKVDLLWTSKDDKVRKFNEQIQYLDDFLGLINVDVESK